MISYPGPGFLSGATWPSMLKNIIMYYYPYMAFGGHNKIVYSTRFVTRRAILLILPGLYVTNHLTLIYVYDMCKNKYFRESRYAPPTLVTVATSHKLSLLCDDKMAAGSHPRSLDKDDTQSPIWIIIIILDGSFSGDTRIYCPRC